MTPEDTNNDEMERELPEDAEPEEEPEPSNETVEVNRDALQSIMADVERLKKENEKLLATADRGRLAHWEQQHREETPRIYRLTTWQHEGEDKVVISWEMVRNQLWQDAEGKWNERQEIELHFEDGESEVVPYREFANNHQKVEASLVSTTQKGQDTFLEVQTDKKTYTVNSTFIN